VTRADLPVVLVAHGTRDPGGRRELLELAAAVQAEHAATVRVGVIEYPAERLPPVFSALADATEEARMRGAGAVRLVPLLLFPAGHAGDDMRVVVRGGRLLHRDIHIGCVPLLRPAPALLAALRDRIAEAEMSSSMRATALLVVGRGSTSAYANRRLRDRVAHALHQVDGRHVGHAFASLAPPTVADALSALVGRGETRILVAPYLLNEGLIAHRIVQEATALAARTPGVRVAVAAHMGLHPAVVTYVAARARGERGIVPAPSSATMVQVPRRRYPRPIVVAGTASGTGKTTVAMGLMAALRRRGLRVQPFKVGPDYIDPLHHTAVAGRISRNLDSVLCAPRAVAALAARAAADADVAVVEGVLGLFDGRLGHADAGSTAEIARLLDAAVILVVDAARSARSTAAVALGFATFDPRLRIAGVILNRTGSTQHADAARQEVERATGVPVLGVIPRDNTLSLPERYLGLVPPQERPHPPSWAERLEALVGAGVDVDRVLRLAANWKPPATDVSHDPFALPGQPPRTRIAVARDAAFTFHYQDALDLLAARGAELIPFSPLADETLPDCGAVLLGGGFPERFAEVLAANTPMREAVAAAVRRGVATVAECGGSMYLGQAIVTEDGGSHPMCGVLPQSALLGRQRSALGYREVTAIRDSPLLRAGEQAMGHEFHWSRPTPGFAETTAAYAVGGAVEGHASSHLLASYVHLHLCGVPAAAARLVAAAERAQLSVAGPRR
jgi:cobyrinic acid a,c-diamide synthase